MAMSSEPDQFITCETREGVATLTLTAACQRAPYPILQQLEKTRSQLATDEVVRALILRAEGKLFSAGVDVADHTPEKVGEMIPLFDRVCRALAEFPVPTIAAVHGHALGGGCELLLCCDLAVMAETASIGQPEIQLAAMAPIAALRLPHLVGYRVAADLLFSGGRISAAEAHRVGLVNLAVPAEVVLGWAQQKASELACLSRAALILNKRALRLGFDGWASSLNEIERLYLDDLMSTADAEEVGCLPRSVRLSGSTAPNSAGGTYERVSWTAYSMFDRNCCTIPGPYSHGPM
jgi:cyclohexa-1,5-dienecarbonyl-CoA hydratase